ncbi:AraC family transcriptional regulator [Marinovum sp. 2_MG-2023]|uniref:AraC family transcriptional regulator n=1 Tax=unclassified Marinovum TaxID=2647166 RepID=UPI0026E20BE7|nr:MULTISPECIES: AraC family transcriptional regulator [unclassified Marinovum]MDO6731434.1 AraC family transcriptional regulator [Marinovum sp. 2_MG-2023]MDO6780794.1 AraC family transcriptional regulator [Marinovum sp. 1_MG-2023]
MTPKDSPLRRRPVAPTFVKEALECAMAGGVDSKRILQAAEVSPDQLDHLDTQEFGRVWLQMSYAMQDEFFGLGARPMRPGSTSLLGHAIRGAATLDVAMKRSLRFLRVVLDDPYGTVTIEGRHCIVTLHEDVPSSNAFKYRAFFLILHGFNCWAARERIPIKAVEFPCNEPLAQNDYGDFFGVPVSFNAPVARLMFDKKYLSRKTDRAEKDLKAFLRNLPEAFLRGYRETDGLKHEIIQKCLSGPAQDWPGADEVAAMLGMSRSSLHRMLKAAGHSLSQLKDEQRRNRATALLSRTDKSISQISEAVGYAEEAAFYRAFHRWYGTTPNRMRDIA